MYDPKIHHRRSIRLQGYDYSQAGMYFITICSNNHANIFGEIVNDEMVHNDLGKIAIEEWLRTEQLRSIIEVDEYVVMPNHIHGILVIRDGAHGDDQASQPQVHEEFGKPTSNTIPTIVRGYKAAVTTRISILRGKKSGSIWQSGYYEELIRTYTAYEKIRDYIANNPAHWINDSLRMK